MVKAVFLLFYEKTKKYNLLLACSDPSGRSRADFTLQMPPPSSNPQNNPTNGTAKENSNTPFLNPDTASSHS
jgi:hypothetical protein